MEAAMEEEDITSELAAKANELQVQADAELEEALPAYEVSRHQADSISNEGINQFKKNLQRYLLFLILFLPSEF